MNFRSGAGIERRGVCRVCRRVLTNEHHAAAGIGPVCALKAAATIPTHIQRVPALDDARAHFDLVKSLPGIVWVQDRMVDGSRSVTNDAENVVKELHNKFPGDRIIYRDTCANWDELRHDGRGNFLGFAPARDMAPEWFS